MKLLQNIKPYIFNIWTLSFLIALSTITYVGYAIRPGLDPSYKFAFNYFFEHNVQIGTDILFTLGPLGFIYAAMPLGNNILIATIATLALKFIFVASSLNLYKEVRGNLTILNWIIIIPMTYVIASGIGIHHVILFIPLIFILTYIVNQNTLFLYFASIITVLALLIKSSTGITVLLILISFSIYSIWKKDYKVPIIIFLSTSILFLISWFLIYHNLNGIYEYFYATLEFSKGNSSIMTLNPDNNWVVFAGFMVLFLTYPLLQKDRLIYILYFVTLLTTAAIFKFSMSRQDHIFEFENYLFDLAFIIFIASKNFRLKSLIHFVLIYISFLAFIWYTPWKNHIKGRLLLTHVPNKPFKNIDAIFTSDVHTRLEKISNNNLKTRVFDKNITTLIGDATVDTYPTFTTYFYVNDLNWKPRPIFQSYITYTPYLDNKNAAFLKSEEAPEFIIWSLEDKMASLGGQYLLNNSPATLYQIFDHYSIEAYKEDYVLFKHHASNNLITKTLETKTYKWNEWIDTPQIEKGDTSSYILAKTLMNRSLLQKVKKLVYKEFEVYMEYKLHNETIKRHRIAVDISKHGLWVNPLPSNLFEYPVGHQVKAIRFSHHRHDYFEDELHITWEKVQANSPLFRIQKSERKDITLTEYTDNFLQIRGWAFVKNVQVDLTKKYIVLQNDTNTFVYTTDQIVRGDITRHFKAKDLHHAGFELHLEKNDLSNGTYNVNLLLIDKNKKQFMIPLDKKIDVN